MTPAAPPRLAMTVLRWILDPADREHALGDLHEEFLVIAARQGSSRASRWYWRQAAAAVPPSLIRRIGRPTRGIGELAHEFRFAVRSLRRRPGLTIVAVCTLALGIGSATAIFSVANAVLFRPLPYPAGERLVQVWNTYDSWRGHEVLDVYWDVIALSYPEYLAWLDAQESFEQVALYGTTPMPLTGAAEPDEVPVGLATESLFPLLGAEPVLGRNFAHEEIGPIAARVAVLSFETWRDAYGSDPGVLGRSVNLAGVPFAIIGVLPRGFWLRPMTSTVGERHAVWVPVGGLGESLGEGDHSYEALALLDEGRTLQSAHAETRT